MRFSPHWIQQLDMKNMNNYVPCARICTSYTSELKFKQWNK